VRCANDAGLFTINGSGVVTIKINTDQEGAGTTGANSGDAPIMALYVNKVGVLRMILKLSVFRLAHRSLMLI